MVRRYYRSLELAADDNSTSTVTIRPELKISNQTVTQKQAGTDCARDYERGARVCLPLRERPTPPVQHTLGVSCGSVQVAMFDGQTVLRSLQARRRTVKPSSSENSTAPSPSARNYKLPIRKLRRNRHGQITHETVECCARFNSLARRRPTRPVQHTLGVSCGSVQVAIFDGQTVLPLPRALALNRETVRAATTPRYRHHLPGI